MNNKEQDYFDAIEYLHYLSSQDGPYQFKDSYSQISDRIKNNHHDILDYFQFLDSYEKNKVLKKFKKQDLHDVLMDLDHDELDGLFNMLINDEPTQYCGKYKNKFFPYKLKPSETVNKDSFAHTNSFIKKLKSLWNTSNQKQRREIIDLLSNKIFHKLLSHIESDEKYHQAMDYIQGIKEITGKDHGRDYERLHSALHNHQIKKILSTLSAKEKLNKLKDFIY